MQDPSAVAQTLNNYFVDSIDTIAESFPVKYNNLPVISSDLLIEPPLSEYVSGVEWERSEEWSGMILNGARSGFFKSRSVVVFTRSERAPLPLYHEDNSCQRLIIELHF